MPRRSLPPFGWVGFNGGARPDIAFARTMREALEDPIPRAKCMRHDRLGDILSVITSGAVSGGCGPSPGGSGEVEFLSDPNGAFDLIWEPMNGWWRLVLATYAFRQYSDEDCADLTGEGTGDYVLIISCSGENQFHLQTSAGFADGTFDEPIAVDVAPPGGIGGLIVTIPTP